MVRTFDHLPIMFDQKDGIPQIALLLNRADQPGIVPGMQADGRFIQYVEHADQFAPNLTGEPNPLRFPPGERRRRAGER